MRGRRFAWQVVVAAVGCVLLAVAVGWVATALNPNEGDCGDLGGGQDGRDRKPKSRLYILLSRFCYADGTPHAIRRIYSLA